MGEFEKWDSDDDEDGGGGASSSAVLSSQLGNLNKDIVEINKQKTKTFLECSSCKEYLQDVNSYGETDS